MSYSFLLESDDAQESQIAAVRDECDDVTTKANPQEGADYFLSDERIGRRLRDEARDYRTPQNLVRIVAASCLDTLATNQAFILKVGQTLGETRDGAKVADAIRRHAASLREAVEREEGKNMGASGSIASRRRMSQSGDVVRVN